LEYYDIESNGKSVGEVETLKDYFGEGDLHIQYIGIDKANQRQGFGSETLREIIKKNPNIKTISAEPTNKSAFNMNLKVLGKPLEIDDGIRSLTIEEALAKLPDETKYLSDGELDSSARVFVRWNKPKVVKTSTKQGMTAINPLTVGAGVSALGAGAMSIKNKKK